MLDNNRIIKYRQAIFKNVNADDVIIDFGCGTGILGFLAIEAGAKHVYAIENTEIINLAIELAKKNEYFQKITFIHKDAKDLSTEDIPEKVDWIICEPISNFLIEGDSWSSIEYLKKFLKKNGKIIPSRGKLYIVPTTKPPDIYIDVLQYLGYPNAFHIDFNEFYNRICYRCDINNVKQEYWASEPALLLDYDLLKDELSDKFHRELRLGINKNCILYGFQIYFDVEIYDKIKISSLDESTYPSWAPQFVPLKKPLNVLNGDYLDIIIKFDHLGDYKYSITFNLEHYSVLPNTFLRKEDYSNIKIRIDPNIIYINESIYLLKNEIFTQYDLESVFEKDILEALINNDNFNDVIDLLFDKYDEKFDFEFDKFLDSVLYFINKLCLLEFVIINNVKNLELKNKLNWEIRIP
ncbi:MAG: methyltransferase domain-containing protein [Candidatus Helarchaeota archaeon]